MPDGRFHSEMCNHLTTIEIELARTREADEDVMQHLAQCETCRAELRLFDQLAEQAKPSESTMAIPAEVDLRMQQQIRQQSATVRRRIRRKQGLRPLRWAIPVAAAAIFAALIWTPLWRSAEAPDKEKRATVQQTDDINLDGQVNILDAFALARRKPSDTGEIERLAYTAVTLDPGPS